MTAASPDRTPDAFLDAPAGRALLALVEGLAITPADLADRLLAVHLASAAMDMIVPWDGNTAARLELLAIQTPSRRAVAERLATTPEMDHWWAPLDRDGQLWSSYSASDELDRSLPDRTTDGPLSAYERFAHKPMPNIRTSTAVAGDLSSLIVASSIGTNDLRPHTDDPIRRTRLTVRADARVYEVTGPASWAALARRYPAILASRGSPPTDRDEIVPDWPAVARDWDGVHVSLGALLLATDVWVTDAAGTSRLWAWDAEGTYWLRWSFDSITPLPDLPFVAPLLADPLAGRPVGDDLDALTSVHRLMAGDGPEAAALRSSQAIGMSWWSPSGPP